jgi:cytochrome bd ubiquinol oxidase subunit II
MTCKGFFVRELTCLALIGVPLVAAYTTFIFWTFKGKVHKDKMIY